MNPSVGIDRRHADRHVGGESRLAIAGDDDRRGLVGPEDRHLLGDVVGVRPGEPGRAHEDERLGRQVDVLLVLGGIAGDRLVAELTELDPDLLGGDLVRTVADDRPVPVEGCMTTGRSGDHRAAGEHLAHRIGHEHGDRRAGASGERDHRDRWPRRWRTTAASRPRPARRRPSWRRRSSPRRGRRTCTARRRPCRSGRSPGG